MVNEWLLLPPSSIFIDLASTKGQEVIETGFCPVRDVGLIISNILLFCDFILCAPVSNEECWIQQTKYLMSPFVHHAPSPSAGLFLAPVVLAGLTV